MMQCQPKKCAAGLLRWALAILLIVMAVNKFTMGLPMFVETMTKNFAGLWFPQEIANVFFYIVPFLEILLGVFLLSGWKKCISLGMTGGLFLIFLFGHSLANIPGAEKVMLYILVTAFAIKMCQCSDCGSCMSCNTKCCETKGCKEMKGCCQNKEGCEEKACCEKEKAPAKK